MFSLNRKKGRLDINLIAFEIGKDLFVLLTGGEEHLGSVTVGMTGSEVETQTVAIKGHKEYVLTQKIGEILAKKYMGNFVICCGIHFDDITREEIASVLKLSCDITKELCSILEKTVAG